MKNIEKENIKFSKAKIEFNKDFNVAFVLIFTRSLLRNNNFYYIYHRIRFINLKMFCYMHYNKIRNEIYLNYRKLFK